MTEPNKHYAVANSEPRRSPKSTPGESSAAEAADTEEQLRALIADYEARIDEVADAITRVRHEINNPLTGVLGQAQLLLRQELDEKTRKRVQTIEELAVRLRDIVGQLRSVQKISRS
jgi:signal transduction histidine kinase